MEIDYTIITSDNFRIGVNKDNLYRSSYFFKNVFDHDYIDSKDDMYVEETYDEIKLMIDYINNYSINDTDLDTLLYTLPLFDKYMIINLEPLWKEILTKLEENDRRTNYRYLDILIYYRRGKHVLYVILNNSEIISEMPLDADLNYTYNNGPSILMWAVLIDDIEIVKLLLSAGVDVNYSNKKGLTALMSTLYNNRSNDIAYLLISHGADFNAVDDKGMSFLMNAILKNNIEMVNFVLSVGVDVNYINNDGFTALMLAILYNNNDMAYLLISHGVDLNIQTNNGYTSLMIAIDKNNIELIDRLISFGADINIQDSLGETALVRAMGNDNIEAFRLLYNAGADLTLRDNDGEAITDFVDQFNQMLEML